MSFLANTIITLAVLFITLRSPALAGLPLLIPQPQRIVANESPAIRLAESGHATFRWDSAGKEPQIEEARKLILAQLAIADHEPSATLSKADASKTGIESATARLANLTGDFREWLKANFTFEKVDPFGGEPVMWLRMIDRIEARAVNDLNARATNATLAGVEGVAVSATSEMKGYAALSVLTSDPTGKGWGKKGGWNSAKRHGPPETLAITFAEPRLLGEVDVFALADDWKRLGEVTRDTPAGELACRSFEVEIRDEDDGNWISHHSVRDSERVWMTIPSPGRPVTGIRLTVTPNRHGYVSIVHVNLNGKFSADKKPAAQ